MRISTQVRIVVETVEVQEESFVARAAKEHPRARVCYRAHFRVHGGGYAIGLVFRLRARQYYDHDEVLRDGVRVPEEQKLSYRT